jgi:hypothetical protein
MKAFALLSLFVVNVALAAPAQEYACQGRDALRNVTVSFNLVLADHDGRNYTHQMLEAFHRGPIKQADLDLTRCTWGMRDDRVQVTRCGNAPVMIFAQCEQLY